MIWFVRPNEVEPTTRACRVAQRKRPQSALATCCTIEVITPAEPCRRPVFARLHLQMGTAGDKLKLRRSTMMRATAKVATAPPPSATPLYHPESKAVVTARHSHSLDKAAARRRLLDVHVGARRGAMSWFTHILSEVDTIIGVAHRPN
jgi:hypothetical protein